jgi:hypothetical protein
MHSPLDTPCEMPCQRISLLSDFHVPKASSSLRWASSHHECPKSCKFIISRSRPNKTRNSHSQAEASSKAYPKSHSQATRISSARQSCTLRRCHTHASLPLQGSTCHLSALCVNWERRGSKNRSPPVRSQTHKKGYSCPSALSTHSLSKNS